MPIQIDLEVEGRKFNTQFCWNLSESHMSPEMFARIIAEENQLPSLMEQEISNQIKKQVQLFRFYQPKGNEMLKTIDLDIRVDNVQFKDQFEWDMNNPNNCPEDFIRKTVEECGLSENFHVTLSHHLREQLQSLQKQIEQNRNPTQQEADLKKSTRSLIESSTGYQP